jgi:hypothetical protein
MMLGAELTAHLGYEDGKNAPTDQANRRNGTSSKRLKGQDGEVSIAVPRDRDGSFEPELVKKGQTRIDGIDDKIRRRLRCGRRYRLAACADYPGLFVQIQLGRLRAPERAVESGC